MPSDAPKTTIWASAALAIIFYFHPAPDDEVCFSRGGSFLPCSPMPAGSGMFLATPEGQRIIETPPGWDCDARGCGPVGKAP